MATPDVKQALEAAGFSTTSLDRIRLSRGVVGKSAYVAGAALVVLAISAYSLKDSVSLVAIAALAVCVFLVFFIGALIFAHKNPGVALLEGAELIQWRQMEMGAKSVSASEIQKSDQKLLGPDNPGSG